MTQVQRCPVCRSDQTQVFLKVGQVPVHSNLLYPSREAALRAASGELQLASCQVCGHIFNLAFDPDLMQYSETYDNALHHSPKFQAYAQEVATRLIESYGLRGKRILDIGCGDGYFLRLICEQGQNRGLGFDPSYAPSAVTEGSQAELEFVQDFYGEKYAEHQGELVCARHVLEHLQAPGEFLGEASRALGKGDEAVLHIEVPNALYTIRDLGIWDLIYEHPQYFSRASLGRLFWECELRVRYAAESYGGQFLQYEGALGRHADDPKDEAGEVMEAVAAFVPKYRQKVEHWRTKLEAIQSAGQRAVVWGTGSKAVTFMNLLESEEQFAYAVDINPRKQGMFVPGSGQQIVSPAALPQLRPEIVIVMNPLYQEEIGLSLKEMGLEPEILAA